MKKFLAMLMAALMIMGTMVGCGESSTTTTAAGTTAAADSKTTAAAEEKTTAAEVLKGEFVMGTGGVAGTWYPMGGGLCAAMSDGNLNVNVQASAGSYENVRLIMSGEREFGLATAAVSYYAYSKQGDFANEDGSMLRAVCAFAPIEMQIVVRADSNINSITDLKGKNVGLGAAGSADVSTMKELLGTVGLTVDDLQGDEIALSEQVTAFKDRRLDVAYVFTTAPTSGILDIASQEDVKLVPIEGTIAENFIKQYPFYCERVISKDKYSFMTEDVKSVGCATLMVCTADLSEEVVYQMTKNLFENVETVQAAHAGLANFSVDDAATGLSIPLHPGAERYYKEIGLIK